MFKKIVSIFIACTMCIGMDSMVGAKDLADLYTSPTPGFFISKTIPEFEKTIDDFFIKYPNRNEIKDEETKNQYDTLLCIKSYGLLLPKKFKDNMDCLTGISPLSTGNEKSVVLYFKNDNYIFNYVIQYSQATDIDVFSVGNQIKFSDKTKIVNGVSVYRQKYKDGAPLSYFWNFSDDHRCYFDVRGDGITADSDYFDYCDLVKIQLNITTDISAGESVEECSILLC